MASRTIRLAGAAMAAAAMTVGMAAPAVAEPGAISPERAQELCEQRAPRLEQRLDRLIDRVTGDASVAGSPASLRARADRAEQAGRDAAATALRARADRREGRLNELNAARDRLDAAVAEHCAP